MQVQINTHDTAGDADYVARVEAQVTDGLNRFAVHLTRIEVHLQDVNADKGGNDKRCMIEARPTHHKPIAVTHEAATLPLAISGALNKMRKALDSALASRTDHKGAPSIRDAAPG